jgi:DNA-binding SARP family transcriptional activator
MKRSNLAPARGRGDPRPVQARGDASHIDLSAPAKLSAPPAAAAPIAPIASSAPTGVRWRQQQQAPRGSPLQLQLAGSPVWLPADGATPVALAARDGALLAWLAIEGATPRARLAALLWPDSTPEAARNTLRQRLFQLRKQLGVDVVVGSTELTLADGVRHDLAEADTLLGRDAHDHGAEFSAWLSGQRAQRLERARQRLITQADTAEHGRDWPALLDLTQRLLALDPLREDAHRRLMRAYYLAGDRAAALRAFDACERMLKDEVGTTPDAETRALLATIERASDADPAPTPRPLALAAAVLRPPRLIGRDRAWSTLQAAWNAREAVLLVGEAGLGKTRLLTDLARSQGRALQVSARPGDERVPYALLTRLLRALFARTPPPETLRSELARLLPEFGEAAALGTDEQRARFTAAIDACLSGQAADAPGGDIDGVLIDDLQFADAASCEALLRNAPAAPRAWIVAMRATELPAAAAALVRTLTEERAAARVTLVALTRAQVGELVASLGVVGDAQVAPLAAALFRRAGGNPLLTLETLRGLLGADVDLTAIGSPAELSRVPMPRADHATIGHRIERLSAQAVRLARCAAVAGQDFSIALAARVLGVRPIDLADPWNELEAAQVMRDGAFAHDLIYEAALASVPAPIARELHREIAADLATRAGEPARIASHWANAGSWPQAGRAYRDAADRARSAGRAVDSAELLAQAAHCFLMAGDEAQRFEALLARATLMVSDDLGSDAREAVAQVEAAAGDDAQRLQALSVKLELAITRFEIDDVLVLAPQAVQAARAQGRRDLELHFAIAWSGALGDARRLAEGVQVLEPYDAWVQQHGSSEQQWEFREALSLALDYAGRLRESSQGWQQCQALARAAGRNDLLWRSLSNGAAGLAKLGRVRQACEVSTQARQLAIDSGTGRIRLLQQQAPHAHRLRDVGRYAEALPLLEEALAGFLAEGSTTDIAMTQQRLSLLFLFLGQPARAQRLLADDHPRLPPGIAMFHQVLRAEVAHGNGADPRPALRAALALVPNTDDIFHRIATLFASHMVAADQGEALAASLAAWASVRERFGLAMSAHVRAAGCALAQGAWQRALPHAEAALTLVRADYQPESFYLGELWPVVAGVLDAAGRTDDADALLSEGRCWVMALHDTQVPPAFRDSFLRRNPANRALLTRCTRRLPAPQPSAGAPAPASPRTPLRARR